MDLNAGSERCQPNRDRSLRRQRGRKGDGQLALARPCATVGTSSGLRRLPFRPQPPSLHRKRSSIGHVSRSPATGTPLTELSVGSKTATPFSWRKNVRKPTSRNRPQSLTIGATFSVIVSNGENTITSNPATLTVTDGSGGSCFVGPTIATQPVSQDLCRCRLSGAGSRSSAGGNGPFTYQWMLNGCGHRWCDPAPPIPFRLSRHRTTAISSASRSAMRVGRSRPRNASLTVTANGGTGRQGAANLAPWQAGKVKRQREQRSRRL